MDHRVKPGGDEAVRRCLTLPVASLGRSDAPRERPPLSAPAIAGEGDRAKHGGGGVRLDASLSSQENRRDPRPCHRAGARPTRMIGEQGDLAFSNGPMTAWARFALPTLRLPNLL